MEILGKYIYGSGNSLDTDILYLVDRLPCSIAECKSFCDSMKQPNENLNIGVIGGGIIVNCFKGTIDELNNAIYRTYCLHEQDTDLLIERVVDRDIYLKVIRSVRSILSHFSRSCLRVDIKRSLRGNWKERLYTLRDISLLGDDEVDLDSLNPNMSGRDVMKLVAFQIGQCRGLFEGIELYTKDEIGERYTSLKKYLNRESDDWLGLSGELFSFYELLDSIVFTGCGNEVSFFGSGGEEFCYDLKKEVRL